MNTVVFTPDWKSNNTACGSGSAGPGRVLLRPAAEDGAPDAGSLFEVPGVGVKRVLQLQQPFVTRKRRSNPRCGSRVLTCAALAGGAGSGLIACLLVRLVLGARVVGTGSSCPTRDQQSGELPVPRYAALCRCAVA